MSLLKIFDHELICVNKNANTQTSCTSFQRQQSLKEWDRQAAPRTECSTNGYKGRTEKERERDYQMHFR